MKVSEHILRKLPKCYYSVDIAAVKDFQELLSGIDSLSRTTEEDGAPQSEPDWMEITEVSGTYTTTYPFTRTRCEACAELFSDLKSVEAHTESKIRVQCRSNAENAGRNSRNGTGLPSTTENAMGE